MKKSAFVNLVVGSVSGLLFALGMCMCLLPEWNAFSVGVVCTGIGFVALVIQGIVAWVRSGRKLRVNWKVAGRVLYGIFAALVLGVGMCLILVWNRMLLGILVGMAGIILLLCLIPMCLGLK